VDTPDALVDAGLDTLVIATGTRLGRAPLLRLARAGLPAFCEKPVALDLATMDRVLEDTARAGILVQIGFQRRFDAGYRAAHEAVADGAVGTILVMRASTHDPSPPSENYLATCGGIFRDLNIHAFDAVRFVSGQEVVEIYADGFARDEWFEEHGDVDVSGAGADVCQIGPGFEHPHVVAPLGRARDTKRPEAVWRIDPRGRSIRPDGSRIGGCDASPARPRDCGYPRDAKCPGSRGTVRPRVLTRNRLGRERTASDIRSQSGWCPLIPAAVRATVLSLSSESPQ